jgi:hypothetical protein
LDDDVVAPIDFCMDLSLQERLAQAISQAHFHR